MRDRGRSGPARDELDVVAGRAQVEWSVRRPDLDLPSQIRLVDQVDSVEMDQDREVAIMYKVVDVASIRSYEFSMTITAKFASVCPCCSRPINPGDQVEWERGTKARHACCPTGDAPVGSTSSRTITVVRIGRRSYLRGDTLAVRGLLRDGGCHWDADTKAWWIGDHAAALTLAERSIVAPAEAAPRKRVTHCLGCGGSLDSFQQQRGYKFCSSDCRIDRQMGGQSGYVNGQWHQGSDD